MCGIVGYIGYKKAEEIIVKGLERLEYRGYDSAGIAYIQDDMLNVVKKQGEVSGLSELVASKQISSHTAIGHTRWATHGEPSDTNSHPHFSMDKNIAIVHNGIIENYLSLKRMLITKGFEFESDTDSEVIAHLIQSILTEENCTFLDAIKITFKEVVGAYAVAIINTHEPDCIYAIKKGSPLVIGVGDDEFFLGSDCSPIVTHTKKVIYLNDDEIVKLTKNAFEIYNASLERQYPIVETMEMELSMVEKNGFDHFMLKEIYEQPTTIKDSMRGRLDLHNGKVVLGGINEYHGQFVHANRYIFLACGTSFHAGIIGQYLFEELVQTPAQVEVASEFLYRNPVIRAGDAIIAISQSGETADTISALTMAKKSGAAIFGVCNVVGSTITRMTDEGAYTHAGVEIGVASTKAFTAQLTLIYLFTFKLAQEKCSVSKERIRELILELHNVPELVTKILKQSEQIREIGDSLKNVNNMLYLGRGLQYPIALEGALKIKEVSYIHAEGYAAGEMKHGPIALIDEDLVSVVIAIKDQHYHKVLSNIKEIKARKGKVIAIVTEGDDEILDLVDYVITIPACDGIIAPILTTIPLQLLSYYAALAKGTNIDKPRNLAKSVTVE